MTLANSKASLLALGNNHIANFLMHSSSGNETQHKENRPSIGTDPATLC